MGKFLGYEDFLKAKGVKKLCRPEIIIDLEKKILEMEELISKFEEMGVENGALLRELAELKAEKDALHRAWTRGEIE